MKLKKAIKILDHHQQWRQGKTEVMFYTPKELTTALDEVLKAVKNLDVGSVVKRSFIALDADTVLIHSGKAANLEGAIQQTYNEVGGKATILGYRWI